jgi:hypothetical protein
MLSPGDERQAELEERIEEPVLGILAATPERQVTG